MAGFFENPLLLVPPPIRFGRTVLYDSQSPAIIREKLMGAPSPAAVKGPPIPWRTFAEELNVRPRTFQFWMQRAAEERASKGEAQAA